MVSGEPDFQKRIKALTDLWYIKGVLLQNPTVAACVPISVENTALAYKVTTDRFKVDIEAMTVGAIETTIANDWTRELGKVDLARVLGAALAHDNPVIARLTDGSAFIDPRDVSDRAARLLGIVYGSLDKLQQQATTKELFVQISHAGVIKDPTQIRTLTSTDVVTAYGSQTQALLQRASTYDLIVQIRHNGVEKDPTQIRVLTSASDSVEVKQATASNLNATVTGDLLYDILMVTNKIDEVDYTWNADGTLATQVFKKSGGTVLTLTYTWNANGTLQKVVRT